MPVLLLNSICGLLEVYLCNSEQQLHVLKFSGVQSKNRSALGIGWRNNVIAQKLEIPKYLFSHQSYPLLSFSFVPL